MQSIPEFRVGQGFDVHAFAEGRPLILGGVRLEAPRGLAGHSDADVLAHAIIDAMLGGASLGDIGRHFPDTDPQWKGADSLRLLQIVTDRIGEAGFSVVNLDATVIAQAPRLAPHIPAMIQRLSEAMRLAPDRINIKATTTERLGFTGRGEGIAAQSVALLIKDK